MIGWRNTGRCAWQRNESGGERTELRLFQKNRDNDAVLVEGSPDERAAIAHCGRIHNQDVGSDVAHSTAVDERGSPPGDAGT